MKTALLILMTLLLTSCTQPSKARGLLESQGYTNVEITGYSWFSCSEDDAFHTGFKATSPTGQTVRGTVCAGLIFKGATIRFN